MIFPKNFPQKFSAIRYHGVIEEKVAFASPHRVCVLYTVTQLRDGNSKRERERYLEIEGVRTTAGIH